MFRKSVKIAAIGNAALILWVILDLFRVPVQWISETTSSHGWVTYLFAIILIGMLANIISLVYFFRIKLSKKKADDIGLVIFNLVIFLLLFGYYVLTS